MGTKVSLRPWMRSAAISGRLSAWCRELAGAQPRQRREHHVGAVVVGHDRRKLAHLADREHWPFR
jgi:hypothetical protein